MHPHNTARGTFIQLGGATQPAPAPRYSVTATTAPRAASAAPDTAEVLAGIGIGAARMAELRAAGVVG